MLFTLDWTEEANKVCTCAGVGTFYNLCHPLPTHNRKCICKPGYSGKHCNKCSSLSYGFPNCKPCECNIFGAVVSKCDDVTGACKCRRRISGRTCNKCALGFYRYPICTACNCPKEYTKADVCNGVNGACICADKYDGRNCERCKDGNYGYPICKACNCSGVGSNSSLCDINNGNCQCRNGFTGAKCDSCQDENKTFPDCMQSEKETQQQEINSNCIGKRNCRAESNKRHHLHHQQEKYSKCEDLFYNDTESRVSTCVPCGCFAEGTVSSLLNCDKLNGKCECKGHVTARACDQCRSGFFNLRQDNIFGCDDCQCDIGGSLNHKCDNNGNCNCKQNIVGKHCDRIRSGDYYLPGHYDMKFEIEDGELENGSPVIYRFSQAEFPSFSWKGYVSFGIHQKSIITRVDVKKTSDYRLLLRFVLLSNNDSFALIKLYNDKAKGSNVYEGIITFQSSQNSYRLGKYAESDELTRIRLTKGQWKIKISSVYTNLLLDHIVLMPKEYYQPTTLLRPRAKACSFEMHHNAICSMFHYVNLTKYKVIKSEDGFVHNFGRIKLASTFDDPDLMRQLKLKSSVELSQMQPKINFNISSATSGSFVVLVEYFVLEKKMHRINTLQSSGELLGRWTASHCPYKFLCRAILLDANNIPVSINLKSNQVKTITMHLDSYGILEIHSVNLIPREEFSNDMLRPEFHCIMKGSTCLKYPKMPLFKESVQINQVSHNAEDKISYTLRGKFAANVQKEGRYHFILRFHQQNHPTFNAKLFLAMASSNDTIERSLEIRFCPSNLGCHVETSIYVVAGLLTVRVTTSNEKTFTIDSVYLISETKFNRESLNFNHVDISLEYLQMCTDDNSLPISNKADTFCQGAFFTQLTSFNDGAFSCNCHPYGSQSSTCNKDGGQCKCKNNIIDCKCFMLGSLSPDCDRNGKCKCKPEYAGLKCDRCKSSLFHSFPECKRVIMNKKNQPDSCSPNKNGRCPCKKFVDGSLCNRCKDPYFNLTISNQDGCTSCKCDVSGTVSGIASCNHNTGQCACKLNVDQTSRKCDTCKDGYYGLNKNDIFGCKACACNKGGSTDNVCDKKTGQCTCKKFITGRKCDKLIANSFYLPNLQHLAFKKKSSIVKKTNSNVTTEWTIDVPKRSSYVIVIDYKVERNVDVDVGFTLTFLSWYQSTVYESKLRFNASSTNTSEVQTVSIKDKSKDLLLSLHQGHYSAKFIADSTTLTLVHIYLIPEDYLSGRSLKSTITSPCTVANSFKPCIKFNYMNLQKQGIISLELEAFRNTGAMLFNGASYPSLNMDGAIIFHLEQSLTISFDQLSGGNFILLLEYFYIDDNQATMALSVQGPTAVQTGFAKFSSCPYTFTCRQTDKLMLIPENEWNLGILQPTKFCTSISGKCRKSKFKSTDEHFMLNASQSSSYTKPKYLPPNMADLSSKLFLLETTSSQHQVTLRWNMSLKRGRFYVILHYYQPFNEGIMSKAIIHTLFYSVSGFFQLNYCPHVSGCRTALVSDALHHQAVYLTGNNIGITINLPENIRIWIDHLLFLKPYDYNDKLLTEKPFHHGHAYRQHCITNYKIRSNLEKRCLNWIFQLTMQFNDVPFNCDCDIKGSQSYDCNFIGGKCDCNHQVTGRACNECHAGYIGFPSCKISKSYKVL
eukprot:gene4597-5200_t